jgi:hypothetical protein
VDVVKLDLSEDGCVYVSDSPRPEGEGDEGLALLPDPKGRPAAVRDWIGGKILDAAHRE